MLAYDARAPDVVPALPDVPDVAARPRRPQGRPTHSKITQQGFLGLVSKAVPAIEAVQRSLEASDSKGGRSGEPDESALLRAAGMTSVKRMAYSLSNRTSGLISHASVALKVLTSSARHYHQWLGLNLAVQYDWETVQLFAIKASRRTTIRRVSRPAGSPPPARNLLAWTVVKRMRSAARASS